MQIADSWLGDLPQQFLGKERIEALVAAFSRQMEELTAVFQDLETITDLDTATGQNLDYVGTIIPLSRKEAGILAGINVDEPVISDERYRQFLRYTAFRNSSECTYEDIMKSVSILWKTSDLEYIEPPDRPATILIGLKTWDIDSVEDPSKWKSLVIKPAGVHLYYTSGFFAVIDESGEESIILRNIRFVAGIPFWYVRTGSWTPGGQKRRYGLGLGLKHDLGRFPVTEEMSLISVGYAVKIKKNETVSALSGHRFGINFWDVRSLDGSWLLDGSALLDAKRRYGLALGLMHLAGAWNAWDARLHSAGTGWRQRLEESAEASTAFSLPADLGNWTRERACLTICAASDLSETEKIANMEVETKTRDYWFLDGLAMLDGTRKLNSVYRKETI